MTIPTPPLPGKGIPRLPKTPPVKPKLPKLPPTAPTAATPTGGSMRSALGSKRPVAPRTIGVSVPGPTASPVAPSTTSSAAKAGSLRGQAKELGRASVQQIGQDKGLSAKEKAKSVAKDVSKSTLQGAAQGAAAGGVHGAAIGAGKGAIQAIAFNKHARNGIIALVLVIALIPAVASAAIVSMVAIAGSSIAASDENYSAAAVVNSGEDESFVTDARSLTKDSTIPWQVAAAVKDQTGEPADIPALEAAIESADPGSRYRYLGAGALYSSGNSVRIQGDPTMAAQVERVWTQAIAQVLDGDTLSASIIYQQALVWYLGQAFGSCYFGAGGSDTPALDTEQVDNAKLIIGVAKSAFGTDSERRQAAIVGVATALQESSLRNLDHGDRDSLGLFQQRASWGTAEQRQTPAYAAGKFFAALSKVSGWATLPVTEAAQAVQISAYPDAYAKWETLARTTVLSSYAGAQAVAIPDAVGYTAPEAVDPLNGSGGVSLCIGANLVVDGDTAPPVVNYIVADEFGWRIHPITHTLRLHTGIDLAKAGCDRQPPVLEPIYAVRAGTVIKTVNSNGRTGYGTQVDIDHGDGLVTRYGHMIYNSLFVKVGDAVEPGTQIGFMGTTGPSTGCHLHFETIVNGIAQNPRIIMLRFGIKF